mmetsp:Transcript_19480/g.28442  ORF Transcript_19480/g.28442 Transcript_19480/m.28442 type:complete len:96 (-) Transcript_19480:382-669(-)
MSLLFLDDLIVRTTVGIDSVNIPDAKNVLKALLDFVLVTVVAVAALIKAATKVQGTNFFAQLTVVGSVVNFLVVGSLQSEDQTCAQVTVVVVVVV